MKGAEALMRAGASSIMACATHAVLSPPSVERLQQSAIREVVLTNSIPLSDEAKASPKIRTLTVAPLLARAIQSIHEETSVSTLFV
jgi:ribose-phosphate pyrophosphokinase